MGDPLSVSAGVVGLVTVSTQLFIAVGSFIGSVKDAPALARDICSEIGAFQSCLGSVSNILSKSSFKAERGSLIAADNVVTTLTDAVLLFHDLDRIVRPLLVDTNQGVRYKRRWAQKKTKLAELVNRLQWHKQTLTLQLAIMKW